MHAHAPPLGPPPLPSWPFCLFLIVHPCLSWLYPILVPSGRTIYGSVLMLEHLGDELLRK